MSTLIDSTLREGGQACGVYFSLADKKRICATLAAIGVEEMEVGVATSFDADLPALMDHCRRLQKRSAFRIGLWCRCRQDDIAHAIDLGPDVLSLSIPGSDLHLTKRLGKTRAWALAEIERSVDQARRGGIERISLGIEDASRADFRFLVQLAETARNCGAFRVRFADTVGIWTPAAVMRLVEDIRRAVDVEVALHTHNDFGMATANAVAGLEAGADGVDVTILGLGERAGNARLEEVAAWLSLTGRGKHYRTSMLASACRVVAKLAGRRLDPYQPVVGARIFSCESGLHLHGLQQKPELYEPFPPEKVGMSRTLFYGMKTGRRALAGKLRDLGCRLSDEELLRLTIHVRQRAAALGRPLADGEIAALARAT